jgi:hypothetical protein
MEQIEKDYNTRRPQMVIPEYGRNIQKMVAHLKATPSKEERNTIAEAIISVMGQLQPHLRDIADFKHKLWDHLYIIADFDLDVDSPYPTPDKAAIFERPERMDYPNQKMRFKHYGKSIEDLIAVAITFDEGDEKNALIGTILNLMKKSYLVFNRDSVDDSLIVSDLQRLSNNKLNIVEGFIFISTKDVLAMTKSKKATHSNNKNQKNNNNRPKQNNYRKKRY